MTDQRKRIFRLTERVACAGWASKLGPAELAQVLGGLKPSGDPRVLVDFTTGDDAGVYRLDDGTALVQTVDFFTPVVDDPWTFGEIAAANALSDVYAMGGRPITALSIAAFPEGDFPPEWGAAIVEGGASKLREASCALLGGHSVRDPEIKFGYAVTGLVDPERMMTNAFGRPGQVLVLTKPIGTGVLATALKAGALAAEAMNEAAASMATLNAAASAAARAAGVRTATDITGFGLVGHALHVARESGLTLEIRARDLPLLGGALEHALGYPSRGLKANRREFGPKVGGHDGLPPPLEALLYDPQTSGGLLLLVDEAAVPGVLAAVPAARTMGRALESGPFPIQIV